MDGKGVIRRMFMVFDEEAAAQARRKRGRLRPGIERQEERVVLSCMGVPGGLDGGMPGAAEGQAIEVSTYTAEVPNVRLGRGGPAGGMTFGRSHIGPKAGPGEMAGAIATCEVSILPVMPAGAQIMGSLTEAGALGGMGGPIGPDLTGQTSDDPAIQKLLDNLTAALNQQKTNSDAIAAKSNLTVTAIDALHQALSGLDVEGLTLDKTAADAAVNALVRAVAAQTDTTGATAAFRALFTDSGVSQAAIDTAISAITRVVTESNLTVADLDTLKADRAAVDAAFQALRDAGHEPFQIAVQSGVAFGGDSGIRGRLGRARKIVTYETGKGEKPSKPTTSKTGSTSNESSKIRRRPGEGLSRDFRFAQRVSAGRRGFGTRF